MTLSDAIEELDRSCPRVPLLALGQTVFWDEPMKAGVAMAIEQSGGNREFVAAVHDTDYFAKLSVGPRMPGKYRSLPHNDSSTKSLWSAAAEFSTLFGSETVVSREKLLSSGVKIEKLHKMRQNVLDEATEAWGWRGIVSLDDNPPISADVDLNELAPELEATFEWALQSSLESISELDRVLAQDQADRLRRIFRAGLAENPGTLSKFYASILSKVYAFCLGTNVRISTSRTTELLRFNKDTFQLPRFQLLKLFVEPETRFIAKGAYDEAIKNTEIYPLERFGTGAIPFDLVIPGKGRGTLRIGNRGIVIMTRQPEFISLKRTISTLAELAQVIESKFGSECVIIGKAVTLIGMLASEFIFVFHHGASSYMKYSQSLHTSLVQGGCNLSLNPVLRIRYETWDALASSSSFINLPAPFQRPFGAEEICAPSFAARWKDVVHEQDALLKKLGNLRSSFDLISFLHQTLGGSWQTLASEYLGLHNRLELLSGQINQVRALRSQAFERLRQAKKSRIEAELNKGDHFRTFVFEKSPSKQALERREELTATVEETIGIINSAKTEVLKLAREQTALVRDPEVLAIHDRRRAIELEAELKRLRLVRDAVITGKGLNHANLRPTAWWFPLVSPDGRWFHRTVNEAECSLEMLTC